MPSAYFPYNSSRKKKSKGVHVLILTRPEVNVAFLFIDLFLQRSVFSQQKFLSNIT